MLSRIRNRWVSLTALAAAYLAAPHLALAAVPAPPTPSTTPGSNDAIAWFEGVFEDASEVGILVIGVVLKVLD